MPILHRNSFGPDGPFQPDYYHWGPHVRVMSPKGHEKLADTPESEWGYDDMTAGVWTVFPNMSIAGSTGTGYMVSQMFPGKTRASPSPSRTSSASSRPRSRIRRS